MNEVVCVEELAKIAQQSLPKYEIRGVFRLVEESPAGNKVRYEERPANGETPLKYLFGGVLLACPRGDRTNGKFAIEVGTRDKSIRVNPCSSSSDAMQLRDSYLKHGLRFDMII